MERRGQGEGAGVGRRSAQPGLIREVIHYRRDGTRAVAFSGRGRLNPYTESLDAMRGTGPVAFGLVGNDANYVVIEGTASTLRVGIESFQRLEGRLPDIELGRPYPGVTGRDVVRKALFIAPDNSEIPDRIYSFPNPVYGGVERIRRHIEGV